MPRRSARLHAKQANNSTLNGKLNKMQEEIKQLQSTLNSVNLENTQLQQALACSVSEQRVDEETANFHQRRTLNIPLMQPPTSELCSQSMIVCSSIPAISAATADARASTPATPLRVASPQSVFETPIHGMYLSNTTTATPYVTLPNVTYQTRYTPPIVSTRQVNNQYQINALSWQAYVPPPHATLGESNCHTSAPEWHAQPRARPHMPHVTFAQPAHRMPEQMPTSYTQPTTTTNVDTVARPLRKLQDLPEFSGLPEQWPMFSVAFRETTAAYNYSNLENQARLQKALKGAARAKVESLLIYPDSVGSAMSALEFHFGRPQMLIKSQIAKVKSMPAIPSSKITEIVNFSAMVQNLTVFLENARAENHMNNPTLLDELVSKLPLMKREEWAKHVYMNGIVNPSIRHLSQWLQTVAMYLSLATECEVANAGTAVSKSTKPTFVITEQRDKILKCVVCSGDHKLYQCDNFRASTVEERWKIVKANRLCFSCLSGGHNVSNCRFRKACGLNSCHRIHNRLLHEVVKTDVKTKADNKAINSVVTTTDNKNNVAVSTICNEEVTNKTLFKFLPVSIVGPKATCEVMAFVDEGSKVSLIDEEITKLVGLKGAADMLYLQWVGGETSSELSQRVDICIASDPSENSTYTMRNVRTTKRLELPRQSLELDKFKQIYAALNNISLSDYENARPKILIGMPHINLVRPLKIINLDENFTVHETKLGNILFGSNDEENAAFVCHINPTPDCFVDLQNQMTEFFSLENFGVKLCEPLISEQDKRAELILKETTKKIGNRYETGLLWNSDDYNFRNSYEVALKRLKVAEKKMQNNKELEIWYNGKINEYLEKSYAKKLTSEEAAKSDSRTWYLPHFVVCNVNKGNKLRLVFDAAALVDGESFNTRLMKGPEAYQPQPLQKILFMFRERKIGVCADIKEMFHRVLIREADQNAQRFLWRNGDVSRKPDVYVMTAMIFGSASSPCSAQFVKNMNAKLHEQTLPHATKAIIEKHYVDDYVDSFDTVPNAIETAQDVVRIHQEAGFELRGFISNSAELVNSLNGNQSIEHQHNIANMCTAQTSHKVLGMYWCTKQDEFQFILKFTKVRKDVLEGKRRPTKAEVLSLAMSIFDPFGILAHVTIKAKIIMQELWRANIDWTSPIPEKIYEEWWKWYHELSQVENIRIPRCYHEQFSNTETIVELHMFVDASEMAYAAVGYWRIKCQGQTTVVFVAGKSRCSPIKPLSIPRLELQAAVLGVRLKDAIINNHGTNVKKVCLWSDSKTVINWIHADCRQYKQFVAYRVAEILNTTNVREWNWVPGELNPADTATRLKANPNSTLWLQGPEFLRGPEHLWPALPTHVHEQPNQEERRSAFVFTTMKTERLIERFEHISKYFIVVGCMAQVVRAVAYFKAGKSRQKPKPLTAVAYSKAGKNRSKPEPFTTAEINNAEKLVVQQVQAEAFAPEIKLLKDGNPLPRSSAIFELNPTIDESGVMRLSGRIDNAQCIPSSVKRPIIMPKNHTVTTLIIRHYHEKYKHQNILAICTAIRQKFWIPCLRQLVRSYAKRCQMCKILASKPKPPLMGQLPIDRLQPYGRPFEYTGLDYFGPLNITVGRCHEKRWVALFTCLTMRAVHLEVARDLTADSTVTCLRNFINRRGVPLRIRCDRGTNFVGASRDEEAEIHEYMSNECSIRGIEWMFNTPGNPSAGGAWERMVRSVKRVLSFTLKEMAPKLETLNSLLIEAENLINSRPLTQLPVESDADEPLTPNHFLIGSPNIIKTTFVPDRARPRKQWKILQQMKQTFWKRWVLEYLPELTRRTKWHEYVKPIQIGDLVLICDENEMRGEWKRGRVVEVFTAADGQVRSAVVRTLKGLLRRPASKLAVLDVDGESVEETVHGGEDVGN